MISQFHLHKKNIYDSTHGPASCLVNGVTRRYMYAIKQLDQYRPTKLPIETDISRGSQTVVTYGRREFILGPLQWSCTTFLTPMANELRMAAGGSAFKPFTVWVSVNRSG
jgi:hypothetical protein